MLLTGCATTTARTTGQTKSSAAPEKAQAKPVPEGCTESMSDDMCVFVRKQPESQKPAPDPYAGLSPQERKDMRRFDRQTFEIAHPVRVGMTKAELESNGYRPSSVSTTTVQGVVHEQWVMPTGNDGTGRPQSIYRYIYLDNGIVTAIQQ
jgi:hypothetical protein